MTPTLSRGWAPLRGIVSGREKYIDLPIPELYDLTADPGESRNLAEASQDRRRELFNLLKQFNVAPPAHGQAESADTRERLRSLGYVGSASAKVKETYTEADDPKRLISLEHTMDRAAGAFARGRIDEAITQYSDVIRQRPDTEDAYRKLALVYWRTGRPREAAETLEAALKNGVTQSEVIIKLGQYLAESGQPAKAIALLEHQAGDDPDALIVLGNAFALAGRRADAARTFSSILQHHPDDPVALENLGAMQLQAGDYADAERSLRRAIVLDPRRAGAHTALGVLLASTGRKDEAIAMWTRALQLDPTDQNARHNLQSIR
jgi:Tfp pilus assembly protein PilF